MNVVEHFAFQAFPPLIDDPKLRGNERENAPENWPKNAPKRIHESFEPTKGNKHFLNFYHLQKMIQFEKKMFQNGLVQPPTFWIDFQRTCYFQGGLLVCVDLFFLLRFKWSPESRRTFCQTPMPCFPVGMK